MAVVAAEVSYLEWEGAQGFEYASLEAWEAAAPDRLAQYLVACAS